MKTFRCSRSRSRFAAIPLAALLLLFVSGCAPVVVTGGVTAAAIVNDERSAGSFIEDQEIEIKIALQISEELGNRVNVSSTSYNRHVLLTGQVPSEKARRHVLSIIKNIKNIREVVDELIIGNPSSLTARASDSYLTAKVKAVLCGIQVEGFSCLNVKVITEQGIVYLLGLVNSQQDTLAVEATQRVSGVLSVKTLFEKKQ